MLGRVRYTFLPLSMRCVCSFRLLSLLPDEEPAAKMSSRSHITEAFSFVPVLPAFSWKTARLHSKQSSTALCASASAYKHATSTSALLDVPCCSAPFMAVAVARSLHRERLRRWIEVVCGSPVSVPSSWPSAWPFSACACCRSGHATLERCQSPLVWQPAKILQQAGKTDEITKLLTQR